MAMLMVQINTSSCSKRVLGRLKTTLIKAALIFIEDKSYGVCARDHPYRMLL